MATAPSSTRPRRPPAGTAYTVSKHGIIGLTKSTAVMYRDRGIRVNAIAPGGTQTPITDSVTFDGDGASIIGRYQENVGRVAAAEEVAAAIAFLASHAASNISGAVLPVDNGWSAI